MRNGGTPNPALAKSVSFTDDKMRITLKDGRVLAIPLNRFSTLSAATPTQRLGYRIGARGRGLHWPGLNVDLSVDDLLRIK